MNTTTLQQVIEYHVAERLACYPFEAGTKSRKLPENKYLSWGNFANIPQKAHEVELLFSTGNPNVAIIAGRPSDNVFFIDADTRQEFENTARLLDGYGISPWTVQRDTWPDDDPHAGGGHFYLKAPEPIKTTVGKLGEVRGQGAYVLAPPSVHPSGSRYQFASHPPTIFRLPTLDAIPELKLQAAPANQGRKMTRKAQQILENGQWGKYKSRSHAEAAAVASLIRGGYSFEMILTLFICYPGTGKFQEMHAKNATNAERYLSLTYRKASQWLLSVDNDTIKLARMAAAWALSKPWPGRTGSSDRAVYLAHCQIVQRCGKTEYHASARDLAELAGIGWRTVSRANPRLIDDGLIELSEKSVGTLANRFTLVESLYDNTPSQSSCMECCQEETLHQKEDAFRRTGLNKSGLEIYQALQAEGGATPKELARITGRGLSTVKKKLAKMADLKMAESRGGKWQALGVDLQDVAKELGTSGQGKRQRAEHLQDRRLHKRQLAILK